MNSNDNHAVKADFIKYSKNSTINQNIVNIIIFVLLYYMHKQLSIYKKEVLIHGWYRGSIGGLTER